MLITMQICYGKRTPPISAAVKVDEVAKSPLPHVIDKKTGIKYLVDTGAEVSILLPTRSDQPFRSFDRSFRSLLLVAILLDCRRLSSS